MADSLAVAVIDYDAGNTLSVTRALEKVGARVDLTADPDRVLRADAVVLPGVGAFGDCMKKLAERGMDVACREVYAGGRPLLGVCVGLQVLFERSEESPGAEGLGILPGEVARFDVGALKVPHMGWNQLEAERFWMGSMARRSTSSTPTTRSPQNRATSSVRPSTARGSARLPGGRIWRPSSSTRRRAAARASVSTRTS